jgi:DNA-binding NarL/FixJ family response regulator
MTERKSLRILIVDDHTVVRQGLAMVLGLQPDFQVVGETGTGKQALELCATLRPDLVLLDLTLPDMNGAAVAHQLREISPETRVLILSAVQDAERVFAAVDAGVEGYVLKEIAPQELAAAIRQVAEGQVYLHPAITRLILQRAAKGMKTDEPAPASVQHPRLTPRELEVLELMATTATNREIAARLVLSEETVRSHVKNILRKLDQPTRTQAVVEALRMGLIQI